MTETEKTRKSITIDKDLAEWADRRNINFSALVNDLLIEYRATNERDLSVLERRIKEEEEKIAELEEKIDRKKVNLRKLRNDLEKRREEEEEKEKLLEEAKNALEGTPLETGNPAVENWAAKLNMKPMELVEELSDGSVENGSETASQKEGVL